MATNPQSTGRSLLSPVFVITAALLLVAAFGLRPTIGALIRHYSKEPIDLRRSLDELDSARLPSFRHRPDRAGVPELTDADGIGTDDWIDMVFQERYPEDEAGRSHMLLLLVTYYSDPRDQVAHTPEVCYRQGGAVVDEIDTVSVETPGLGPQTLKVDARRLVIDQGGRKKILLYVFCCNGEFYNDREQVRFAIGWPGDKHVYFSKVEAVAPWVPGIDKEIPTRLCQRLLGEALPVLVDDHFPRQEDLRRR